MSYFIKHVKRLMLCAAAARCGCATGSTPLRLPSCQSCPPHCGGAWPHTSHRVSATHSLWLACGQLQLVSSSSADDVALPPDIRTCFSCYCAAHSKPPMRQQLWPEKIMCQSVSLQLLPCCLWSCCLVTAVPLPCVCLHAGLLDGLAFM
jgi:hypothetical protein